MVTVLLYGELAKKFGKSHSFDIKTPAEAVRALSANFKEFKKYLIQESQLAYKVMAGKEVRSNDKSLHLPVGKLNIVKIIPIIHGANGFGRVILGAALIAASFYLPGAGAAVGTFSASSVASSVGISLVLGGITSLLFAPLKPQSISSERPENKPSYAFNGAVNTIAQGNPVPYFYGGPSRIGSQVISAGLAAENL